MIYDDRKLKEECGVFGIWSAQEDEHDPVRVTHTALYCLQHRGQEACGIAANDRGVISVTKGLGLVSDVFNEKNLAKLSGNVVLGHVRYSTNETNDQLSAQPLVISHMKGNLAIANNGVITNAAVLRAELEQKGCVFHTKSDSEIIAYLIVAERLRSASIEEAVMRACERLEGAYSMLVMSPRKLMAVRDPYGFRPLCIGSLDGSQVFASESCAFNAIGAKLVRDVKPGELVLVENGEMRSIDMAMNRHRSHLCVFEYVYFARPDSVIDSLSVDIARQRMGAFLADEHPVDADIVIGVPDSGLSAAIGYSNRSGIPYGVGLVKNRYIARTFIQPTQRAREDAVRLKLNAMSSEIYGKRVVMVDDSIVRGTTGARIVSLLREAGATEVHMRLSSPPFVAPCYYGTDVPDKKMLIAANHSIEEMTEIFGVDSLGFLSLEALEEIAKSCSLDFCTSCFTDKYPIVPKNDGPVSKYERKLD
ncbi:MAG: amidophosphoribosyltransferase [Clostridiales bacterium]|nr:amidophosphoribosyltransferase [Clostridiales bacterium]